jgi:hypothetical protein
MDKRYSQLELFGEERARELVPDEPGRKPFISRINRYQQTIFLLIGFVITGILFYCLGVEQGKSRAMGTINAGFDFAARQPSVVRQAEAKPVVQPVIRADGAPRVPVKPVVLPKTNKVQQPVPVLAEAKGGFTVQIGTYQAQATAQRERDKLTKLGFSPLIVKQGVYNVVIVGSFCDKEKARSLLSKLRQNYGDCYIRRL